MVLLATRIVLNSFAGLSDNFKAYFERLLLFVLNFSISSGLSEKKATSEPEIRADPQSNSISTIIPVIIFISGVYTAIPEINAINDSEYSDSN